MKQVPVVNQNKCMKCHTCMQSCPENAISEASNTCCAKCIKYCMAFPVPCHPHYLIFNYDVCTSCAVCVSSCPYDALIMCDYDMLTMADAV